MSETEKIKLQSITPVLPSQNIKRDVEWYNRYVGFIAVFADKMYAVIERDGVFIHLQWHADTEDDPLLGGSVIRISVQNIQPIFQELILRGTVDQDQLRMKTAWNTNEFGFYDLNKNAIFFQNLCKQCPTISKLCPTISKLCPNTKPFLFQVCLCSLKNNI